MLLCREESESGMKCNSCGHERPRTGNCPHCGAVSGAPKPPAQPAPGSRSSLREWKGGAQPTPPPPARVPEPPRSATPSRSRGQFSGAPDASLLNRTARPNNDSRGQSSSSNQSRRPTDPRYQQDYPRVSPPRRSDPDEYEDDLGYPSERQSIPDRQIPQLPAPATTDSMKMQVFIPAIPPDPHGNRRLLIGIAGMLGALVLFCSIAASVAKSSTNPLTRLGNFTIPSFDKTPVANVPTIYLSGSPLVTPVPKAPVVFSSIITARHYTNINNVVTPRGITALFQTNETVNVIAKADQAIKPGDTFTIKWFFNNQDITGNVIATNLHCCDATVADSTGDVIAFTLPLPAPGLGSAKLFYNGTFVATVLFAVTPPANTPTPAPTALPTKVPSATPSK